MKKITSIATALCMATAFCGFCAGCASDIQKQENGASATPSTSAQEQRYASSVPKVILCPGYQNGYGSTPNTINSTGAVALTKEEEELYWVDNAYLATVDSGEELPIPQTTRADTTFVGWTYAQDGVVVTINKMPYIFYDDLILYAKWYTKGQEANPDGGSGGGGGSGGSGGGGEVVTSVVAVNNQAMKLNENNDETSVKAEYMLTGVELETGEVLNFTLNGTKITISALEGASTGLTFAGGVVSVANGGTFDLYLKEKTTGEYELYGSREKQVGEASIFGEIITPNNIYLAGNVAEADIGWNTWTGTNNKGLKAEYVSSGKYTLTVPLTQGDNCKFVMTGATTSTLTWQGTLSGGGSYISFVDYGSENMTVKVTGTYTFTITVGSGSLSVSVVKVS